MGKLAIQKVKRDFSDLSDEKLDSWIQKLLASDLSAHEQTVLALEERARRQSKVLKVEVSISHLIKAAKARAFTTYGALAEANGVEWKSARHYMNGAGGHLDRIVEICHVRGMPLLTAICVNQGSVTTGELSAESLQGFINAAVRLGYKVTDRRLFLSGCQEHCFEWASSEFSEVTQ